VTAPLRSVLWRGESLSTELFHLRPGVLEGEVLLVLEGAPTRVDYNVEVDDAWLTRRTMVRVRRGDSDAARELILEADGQGHWRVDGQERPDLDGCTDVDLGVSPSTNTLPIRRLEELAVSESAEVRAAWVRFPEVTVEVLDQRYTRLGGDRWLYASGNDFRAELRVDELGVVITYGDDNWHTLARS